MARPQGRPREQPDDLVYLRLAVTPEEHRHIQVAAGLAGTSMAKFARKAVADAARAKITSGGLDPERLPEPAAEEAGEGDTGEQGAAKPAGRRRRKTKE